MPEDLIATHTATASTSVPVSSSAGGPAGRRSYIPQPSATLLHSFLLPLTWAEVREKTTRLTKTQTNRLAKLGAACPKCLPDHSYSEGQELTFTDHPLSPRHWSLATFAYYYRN